MQGKARLPRLLDGNLHETARLHPAALSADLKKRACSTAQMTLPDEDPRLDHMPFAELYASKGSLGIFRVFDSTEPINGTRTYTLRHAIDTLRDSLWRQRTDYRGTVAGFLSTLLSFQTVTRWQLGVCQDQGTYNREEINYDHLDELLNELRESREGYYFTYDFSTVPWTLNFIAENGTVAAEMRKTRNLADGSLCRTRDGQVNRLYLSVKNGNSVTYTQYDDAASQAAFGVLEGTATVDSAEVSDPAAWAAQFLQDHGAPIPSANCDGYEIVKSTGEPWDALDIGKTVRVAIGREGFPISLPIEALRFENVFGDEPEKVRVELNRRLPKFSERLAQVQKAAGGAGGRSKKNEEKIKQFETYEVKTDEMIGMVAHALGVVLDSGGNPVIDPQTGKLVYDQTSAAEIFTHLSLSYNRAQLVSAINDGTGTQISGSKIDLSASGNVLIQAINGSGGSVKISAGHIELDGATVATSLYGQDVAVDDLVAGQVETDSLDVTGSANFQSGVSTDYINNVDVTGIGAVVDSIGPATALGGEITIPWMRLDGTPGTPINFNIADTQFYIDGVSAARTAGYNEARRDWRADNIRISGKNVIVLNSAGDDVGGPYSAAAIYNDGFSDGEDQFTLASVTLQGSAQTVYEESASGTDYYQAASPVTYYKGDGGSFTVEGSEHAAITPVGTAVRFQVHPRTDTPTGYWYELVSSGGTTYYNAGTQITGLRNPGTTTKVARGSQVAATPIDLTTKKTLASVTRYGAGSVVADTYYTKS